MTGNISTGEKAAGEGGFVSLVTIKETEHAWGGVLIGVPPPHTLLGGVWNIVERIRITRHAVHWVPQCNLGVKGLYFAGCPAMAWTCCLTGPQQLDKLALATLSYNFPAQLLRAYVECENQCNMVKWTSKPGLFATENAGGMPNVSDINIKWSRKHQTCSHNFLTHQDSNAFLPFFGMALAQASTIERHQTSLHIASQTQVG